MQLKQARAIADKIIDKLAPHCTRIEIAGSIRRERSDVGDIEIMAMPKMVQVGGSLFDTEPPKMVVSNGFTAACRCLGDMIKDGARYKKIAVVDVYGRINLDLFIPEEYDYIRQLVIRTGSADYAARVIAMGWRKIGWCGTDDGLRLVSECENINEGKLDGQGVRMKAKWKCVALLPTKPPAWKSEEEFFLWLGIPYLEPKYRNII